MSRIKAVIYLAVALMVVAVIFPIALGLIGDAGNTFIRNETVGNITTSYTLSDLVDPSIITLLTVLIPIIAVIAVVLYFLPQMRTK